MDQILALHGVHAAETLRRDHADYPILIAEIHLVWRRKSLLQDSFELPKRYRQCKTPLSINRWAALRSRRAIALSGSPFNPSYNFIFLMCARSRASEAKR